MASKSVRERKKRLHPWRTGEGTECSRQALSCLGEPILMSCHFISLLSPVRHFTSLLDPVRQFTSLLKPGPSSHFSVESGPCFHFSIKPGRSFDFSEYKASALLALHAAGTKHKGGTNSTNAMVCCAPIGSRALRAAGTKHKWPETGEPPPKITEPTAIGSCRGRRRQKTADKTQRGTLKNLSKNLKMQPCP